MSRRICLYGTWYRDYFLDLEQMRDGGIMNVAKGLRSNDVDYHVYATEFRTCWFHDFMKYNEKGPDKNEPSEVAIKDAHLVHVVYGENHKNFPFFKYWPQLVSVDFLFPLQQLDLELVYLWNKWANILFFSTNDEVSHDRIRQHFIGGKTDKLVVLHNPKFVQYVTHKGYAKYDVELQPYRNTIGAGDYLAANILTDLYHRNFCFPADSGVLRSVLEKAVAKTQGLLREQNEKVQPDSSP